MEYLLSYVGGILIRYVSLTNINYPMVLDAIYNVVMISVVRALLYISLISISEVAIQNSDFSLFPCHTTWNGLSEVPLNVLCFYVAFF